MSDGRIRWRRLLSFVGGYLVFGLTWILLSDRVVEMMSAGRSDLSVLQTYKGLLFVLLSTGLIAVLLARGATRHRALDGYWRDVVDLADEGFWLLDAAGRTRMVNQRMASLLGREPDQMLRRSPFDFVAEEDRGTLEDQIGRSPGEGRLHTQSGPRRYELQMRHRDGRIVPFLVHATALRDVDGVVIGSYAFMTDLTEIRRRERALHLTRYAIDHCFDEIYRIGRDGRILDANRAACHNLQYRRDELVGRMAGDITTTEAIVDRTVFWRELQQRGALTLETEHCTRDGARYPVEVALSYMVYEGEPFAYAIARDLRARKAAEASARRANEALRALSRANAALNQATDQADLFERVCEALTSSRGYPLAWVGLAGGDAECTVEIAAASGEARAYLDGLHVTYDAGPRGRGPTGRAIRTGEVQVLRHLGAAPQFEPWRAAARQHGFRTSASLPVRVDERVIGALNVYSAEPASFDERELPLLAELASELGFGVRSLDTRADRDRQLARLRLAGAVFDNSAEAIVVTDADKRVETVNKAFTEISGYVPSEVIGHEHQMRSGYQDEPADEQPWAQLERGGSWQGELWSRRRSGDTYPQWLTLSAVRNEVGAITNYVITFADLTQAHRTQQELAFRTYHDALTGLPNRARFRERLGRALEATEPRLAVVLLDLQNFRALNDSFGADVGDDVLCRTAARLRTVLRPQDIIARPGGDEFWIAIEDEYRHPQTDDWIRELMAAISMPMAVAGQTVRLEANMGVALAPEDGTGLDELLTNAATALHRAQEQGPGLIDYFHPDMHEAVQRRVRTEEALKAAIERNELRVWYQPQIDLATSAIRGAEALVRWQHPERGLLAPGEFMETAEAAGLAARIGDWVLERALERLAQWRAAGHPIDRISVNASATQLQWAEWPERVHAMLERTGVPAHCLEIEITEDGVLGDLHSALTTMEWLKALDIRLAIDDFGKGYSSLANLKQFPIDRLKIDKGFIDGLPDVEYDRSIAQAILAVSSALGLQVVAEGVETSAQAEWLRAHGVEQAQGFLFYRPQPAEKIEELFVPG